MIYSEIPRDYFFREFQKNYDKIVRNEMKEEFDVSWIQNFKHEKLKWIDTALWETCIDYISLAEIFPDELPEKGLDFASYLLNEKADKSLKTSFEHSMVLMSSMYLASVEAGFPLIYVITNNSLSSVCDIWMDQEQNVKRINMINMDLKDRAQTLLRLCLMIQNKTQGPIPFIRMRNRK